MSGQSGRWFLGPLGLPHSVKQAAEPVLKGSVTGTNLTELVKHRRQLLTNFGQRCGCRAGLQNFRALALTDAHAARLLKEPHSGLSSVHSDIVRFRKLAVGREKVAYGEFPRVDVGSKNLGERAAGHASGGRLRQRAVGHEPSLVPTFRPGQTNQSGPSA